MNYSIEELTKEIEKPRTRELISKPMYSGAPLHWIDKYFKGQLKKFRSEHIEFDIFLKQLGDHLQANKDDYLNNLKRFINNDPVPNWVSPRDCMFNTLVKLFNLDLSPAQAYEYIQECLVKFKEMEKTEFRFYEKYDVLTKRSRWDGKQRKWIKISISPVNHDNFWFSLTLESLQIDDDFNDMKVHDDVEITLHTSEEKYQDALLLFEFYQNTGFYRNLHQFAMTQLKEKGIIEEIKTEERVGLLTHLYKIN